MVTPGRQDEIKLAEYLLQSTLDQLNGRGEDVCQDDRPRNRYFIGSLANRSSQDEDLIPDDDLFSRLSPSAMGLDVLAKPEGKDASLIIRPHFNVYYRIFPGLKHQRRISGYESEPETGQNEEGKGRSGEWAIAYRKLVVNAEPIEVQLPSQVNRRIQLDTARAQKSLEEALAQAKEQVLADPLRYRESSEYKTVPQTVLVSQDAYATFVTKATAAGQEIAPQWQVQLSVQVRPDADDLVRVSVMLSNVSADDQSERCSTDHYLFDVNLYVEGRRATIYPFIFDILPEDYRYDRELWGLGRNCVVRRVNGRNAVETLNSPIYRQPVYTTRDAVTSSLPKAAFQAMADDPLPILKDIAAAMTEYQTGWEQLMEQRRANPAWTPEMLEAAQGDLNGFVDEIARFRRGIRALERYDTLRHAFQLMNQTFANASSYRSWRLFQIV